MTTAVVEDWFARSSGVSDGIIGVTVWAVAAGFISAFHIVGNDNLRRVSFADGLQVF
jgi:hypothetical protein